MILIIDNYDSFVYNLARYIGELGYAYIVKRNDVITMSEVGGLNPSHIIISPGPCTPDKAGVSISIIHQYGPSIPILGVCLGHQAIGQAYGGKIVRAIEPMHGKSSKITHNEKGLFTGLVNPLPVGRYHSLVVSDQEFPSQLQITAYSDKHEIMALCHKEYPVFGVQFHPESVLTEQGHQLLSNFLKVCP